MSADAGSIEDAGQGALAENITHFARALRKAGLKVGPGATHDAIEALCLAGIGTKQDFYWTLHAIFVKRHEDEEVFEQAFTLFWRKRALMERMLQALMPVAPAPARARAASRPMPLFAPVTTTWRP